MQPAFTPFASSGQPAFQPTQQVPSFAPQPQQVPSFAPQPQQVPYQPQQVPSFAPQAQQVPYQPQQVPSFAPQPQQMTAYQPQIYQQPQYRATAFPLYDLNVPDAEPLVLLKEQIPHFQDLVKIYSNPKKPYLFNTSEPGTGKTWVTGALAMVGLESLPDELKNQYKAMGLKNVPIIWITPGMVVGKVRSFLHNYGLANYGAYSYDEMIARGASQPKHGFVEKQRDGTYRASQPYLAVVNTPPGVFLIIDESHSIKNKKAQRTAAVTAMISATVNSKYGFTCFLSATPLDKGDHSHSYLQALGMMPDTPGKKIGANAFGRGYELGTAADAITGIYKTDPQATVNILARVGGGASITGFDSDGKVIVEGLYDTKTVKKVIYELFKEVIYIPNFSRMIMPMKADVKNLYLYYSEADLAELDKLVKGVIEATGYNVATDTAQEGADKSGDVGVYIKNINMLLARRIPDYVANFLNQHPHWKVVFFTKSVDAADAVARALQLWNPLVQHGQIDKKSRPYLIDAFQQPNDNHRIFISTTLTGGIGIDLDDKNGQFTRLCLILPDFSLIDHVQALGRVLRMSTKSVPHMRTVYPINYKGASLERITTAVMAKSDTLKDFTDRDESRSALNDIYGVNIMYPTDYPPEFEQAPPVDGKRYPPRVK